jgi:carboxylesterase type B
MGEAQHRRFWRRSRQSHDRGRIRRLGGGERAHGFTAREGAVLARDRRERRNVRFAQPLACVAREGRGRRPRLHAQSRSENAGRTARRPRRGHPRRRAGARLPTKQSYADLVHALFGDRSEEALRHYPGGSPESDEASARALGGDLTIIHPTWAWIEAQRRSGGADIFRFRFDHAPLTPPGWFGERASRDAGAFHASELFYVFDNLHVCPWLIDDADRALARLASSYWISFVKTGDPNGPGLPRWQSYRGAGAPVMMLDALAHAGLEEGRERHIFLKEVVSARANALPNLPLPSGEAPG